MLVFMHLASGLSCELRKRKEKRKKHARVVYKHARVHAFCLGVGSLRGRWREGGTTSLCLMFFGFFVLYFKRTERTGTGFGDSVGAALWPGGGWRAFGGIYVLPWEANHTPQIRWKRELKHGSLLTHSLPRGASQQKNSTKNQKQRRVRRTTGLDGTRSSKWLGRLIARFWFWHVGELRFTMGS